MKFKFFNFKLFFVFFLMLFNFSSVVYADTEIIKIGSEEITIEKGDIIKVPAGRVGSIDWRYNGKEFCSSSRDCSGTQELIDNSENKNSLRLISPNNDKDISFSDKQISVRTVKTESTVPSSSDDTATTSENSESEDSDSSSTDTSGTTPEEDGEETDSTKDDGSEDNIIEIDGYTFSVTSDQKIEPGQVTSSGEVDKLRTTILTWNEDVKNSFIKSIKEGGELSDNLKIAAKLEGFDVSISDGVNLGDFKTSTLVQLANVGDEEASINELKDRVENGDVTSREDLNLVASIKGNSELKKDLYGKVDPGNLKFLCDTFSQDCLTYTPPEKLEGLVGQTKSINQADLISCMETPDCRNNIDSDEDFIEDYNEENCEGGFNSLTACYFADQIDNREIFADSLRQRLQEDDFKLELPVEIVGELSNGEKIKCKDTADNCIGVAEDICDDDEDCINQAKGAILKNAKVKSAADMTKYNNNLGLKFIDEYCGSNSGENCPFNKEKCSGEECIEHIRGVCEEENNYKCATGIEQLDSQKMIETNAFYAVASWVTHQDENTQRVMNRIFGGPVGYDAPSFVTKPFASQICYAKFKGYLDKEKVSGGGGITIDEGTTVYGGDETNREVRADVRAQHTLITPDNKASIVFSYYLKSLDKPLNYRVSGSYKDIRDNSINIFDFTDTNTTLRLAENSSESVYNPSFNGKEFIPQEYLSNFRIHLVAVDDEGNIVHSISHPIIPVTSSDRDLGEIQANNENTDSENSGDNQEEIDIDQVITDSILEDIN